MSAPCLPPEILDHIVDRLHTSPEALKECCLVSKSWIPRTRQHLFANITFHTKERLGSWKKTFPEPSTSPGYYTKSLSIGCPYVVTTADAEPGGWITGFSRATDLGVDNGMIFTDESATFLIPFHGFSPSLKSLHMSFTSLPASRTFDLILSFPLLEDLKVTAYFASVDNDHDPDILRLPPIRVVQPSANPPRLTGSLELLLSGRAELFAHWLCLLTNGIHFRKLTTTWNHGRDLSVTAALVERCSHTLEAIQVTCIPPGRSTPAGLDISKAIRLRNIIFLCGREGAEWVATTLRYVTSNHRNLRQITLSVPGMSSDPTPGHVDPPSVLDVLGEAGLNHWLELDRVLAQLWESHSIRPKILHFAPSGKDGRGSDSCVHEVLPEITRRGIADLIVRG